MKHKILAFVLAAVLFCCSSGLALAADNDPADTDDQAAQSAGQDAADKEDAALDDLLGIRRDPVQFHFQAVAQSDQLLLELDEKECALRLTAKKTGAVWQSSVSEYPTDQLASGLVRNQMASLLVAKYVDRLGNITAISSKEDCVDKKTVQYAKTTNGVKIIYRFSKPEFVIPVEYTLQADGLCVSVLVDEIKENNKNYRLHSVSLQPYFGTGSQKDEGYLLVPDGSGARIRFNNNKGRMAEYVQDIYGRDGAIAMKAQGPVVQTASLPVFGIRKNNQAFLAVITNGDARARLHASVSGISAEYNNVYPEFFYRNYDSVVVKEKNWDSKTVKVFEDQPASCKKFAVVYYPLTEQSADDTGMALRYRQYLKDQQKMTEQAASTPALYLELYGSVKKLQYFLGIPYVGKVKLTTYSDVSTITDRLQKLGVRQMVLQYQNWGASSSDKNIPTELKPASVLGGTKGFDAMMQTLEKQKIPLYCDINLTEMNKNRWGYHQKWDGSKALQKSPTTLFTFHLGTYESDPTKAVTFLLQPGKVLKAAEQTAKNAAKLHASGLSADTLGQQLYSDFSKNKTDRTQTQQLWQQSLQKLAGSGDGLLLCAPNAYAFSAATHITDVPIDSSHYLIADEAVPFYAIALHGLVNLSLPAVNYQSNPRAAMLKAIELGVGLKFTWTAQNEEKLTETELNGLYNGHAQNWIADAAQMQKVVTSALTGLTNQPIVGHETLAQGVVKTTYPDQTAVYVNYTNQSVVADGQTILAENFWVQRK